MRSFLIVAAVILIGCLPGSYAEFACALAGPDHSPDVTLTHHAQPLSCPGLRSSELLHASATLKPSSSGFLPPNIAPGLFAAGTRLLVRRATALAGLGSLQSRFVRLQV